MANKGLKRECLDAVSTVIGRGLTQKEGEDIVTEIKSRVTRLKQEKPELSKHDLIAKASEEYAKSLEEEAKRKVRNAHLQVSAIAKVRTSYANMRNKGISANEAAKRVLDNVDKQRIGIQNFYTSGLVNLLERTAPKLLGLVENTEACLGIIRELSGINTGNNEFKAAAKAWKEVTTQMRERFNRAGGDVGLLEDWVMPQTHSRYKVLNAQRIINRGAAGNAFQVAGELTHIRSHNAWANKEAWVSYVFDRIDRSRYLNDDLQPMNDIEVRSVLRKAYDSIATNGDADISASLVAGTVNRKSTANKHAEHRKIHFKSPESRLEYNRLFGQNPSIFGTMLAHVGGMSRDIALLEEFGPSPNSSFNTISRMAQVENNQAAIREGKEVATHNRQLKAMWSTLNGEVSVVEGNILASVFQGARNLQIAGKLGGAFITSLSDVATYFHTAHVNGLSFMKSAQFLIKSLNPFDRADKHFIAMAGFVGDELNSAATRFVDGNLGYGVTSKLADLTMRLSLLSQWTDSVRRAQAMATMSNFAEVKKYDWDSIDGWLRERMQNFGLDKKMWQVLQEATPETFDEAQFLTKNSILSMSEESLTKLSISRAQLEKFASRYVAFIADDAFMASLQPDLATRSISNMGLPKGTWSGELWRSIMLFKSFPIAMMTRHIQRSGDLYRYKKATDGTIAAVASRTGYYATLIVGTTLTAWVANMFKDLLAGTDVKDPFSKDAALRAFTSGGGAGFVGDILVSSMDDYKYGHPAVFNMAGPVLSTVLDSYTIFDKLKDHKDVGANILRVAKGNIPLVNLWYTKQMLNHAVFNQIQEVINPGYHKRIERKLKKRQGIRYWWQPTKLMPSRAPRLGNEVK